MNISDRLDEMEKQIDDLQKWKSSCNMLMAGWGGVCMAVLTTGGLITTYYQNIKSYLVALWSIK